MFPSFRNLVHAAAWGPPLCVIVLCSCRGAADSDYEKSLEESARSAHHAVHSDRLLQLMAELERWTFQRLPQEMEIEVETQRRVSEVSYVSNAMAEAADHIPDILEDVELSAEYRQEFNSLANVLKEQAKALHEEAERISIPEMRQRLDTIVESCNACHQRFRILPAATTTGQ